MIIHILALASLIIFIVSCMKEFSWLNLAFYTGIYTIILLLMSIIDEISERGKE